jgi:hypothetical protein
VWKLHDEYFGAEVGEEEKTEERHPRLFTFWNDCLNQKEGLPG